MRGGDTRTGKLFSSVDLEARVRRDHPLRAIRTIVNEALEALEPRVYRALFADWATVDPAREAAAGDAVAGVLFDPLGAAFDGAAGIRPAVPLVRRDRRRRCGLGPFGVLRDRLLEGDIAAKFLAAVLAQSKVNKLLSSDHFSVDGTLIEAWTSTKSAKPKDGSGEPPAQGGGRNAEADFHDQKRSNDTHASTTDADARLYRKGKDKETKLCFIGHGLMENRHGLLVDACRRACRTGGCAAHDRASCRPADTEHAWRRQSLRRRRLRQRSALDEGDGGIKTIAGQEKSRFRGCDRVGWAFTFAAAGYNLVRLPKLIAEAC